MKNMYQRLTNGERTRTKYGIKTMVNINTIQEIRKKLYGGTKIIGEQNMAFNRAVWLFENYIIVDDTQ